MVYSLGIQNQNINTLRKQVSFGKEDKKSKCENKDRLLIEEKKKHPVSTAVKIQTDKLVNAFTKYPQKGLEGSKNANFYEFLTMGTVPYLIGSAAMISVFNLASKFFSTPDAVSACKLGKKMGIGVIAYGILKNISKKFIEVPVNLRYGIDVNLPYKKVINELPEERNKDNLVSYEYHKAYESVDFPRWDLFYDNEAYGKERTAYYKHVGKKMGISDEDLEHADQKVKPLIKEKLIQTKLFSTLSSYFWAATGVGIAMQKPWENMTLNPKKRILNYKNYKQAVKQAGDKAKNVAKYENIFKEFGKNFVKSFKEFINNERKSLRIAGRTLFGAAVGLTLLGNFVTLLNFNKGKGSREKAAVSLIDESKEKVVC